MDRGCVYLLRFTRRLCLYGLHMPLPNIYSFSGKHPVEATEISQFSVNGVRVVSA